jgi:Glycosyl transferase family 2
MPPSLPSVSVLMGAYNYEQYVGRAVESALAQDYPADRLEIIVIDDGSTDSTADVVAEIAARHPGRVRLIRQSNGGYIAATNRAMSEAHGDLLALLDADDVWLPDKTRRQVEMFAARPALGLVFSDMVVVDGDERPLRPSLIGHVPPIPQRAFARFLFANVATQSSIMVRSSLREVFDPIPDGIPYADWWLAVSAARVSEVDYIREPLALYREHGSNLTGGVTGAAGIREHCKEVAFHRWSLRHLPLDTVTPDELAFIWSGVEEHARRAIASAGTHFVPLAETTPEDRAEAQELLARADGLRASGDYAGEATATMRALACNPYAIGARQRLIDSVAAAKDAENRPHPLQGARGFVVLADAEELLADDGLLVAYADAVAGCEQITLAIDATRLPAQSAGVDLESLVGRCGCSERDDIDLIAVIGPCDPGQRHRMLSASHASFSRRSDRHAPLPGFNPAALPELRALAESAPIIAPHGS